MFLFSYSTRSYTTTGISHFCACGGGGWREGEASLLTFCFESQKKPSKCAFVLSLLNPHMYAETEIGVFCGGYMNKETETETRRRNDYVCVFIFLYSTLLCVPHATGIVFFFLRGMAKGKKAASTHRNVYFTHFWVQGRVHLCVLIQLFFQLFFHLLYHSKNKTIQNYLNKTIHKIFSFLEGYGKWKKS